jgi:hypothetical protein
MAQLKSLAEAQRREGSLNRLPPRFAAVEVRRIIGSVSQTKVDTLTGAFLLRKDGANAPRYRSVLTAMRTDVPLPPIEVYALGEEYYVVDGHHRVAAARALGYLYLDALVHECVLPLTSEENRLHNERRQFARLTSIHLYPPHSGTAAAVFGALQAVGALVRPVAGVGWGGRALARAARRDRRTRSAAHDHEGRAA